MPEERVSKLEGESKVAARAVEFLSKGWPCVLGWLGWAAAVAMGVYVFILPYGGGALDLQKWMVGAGGAGWAAAQILRGKGAVGAVVGAVVGVVVVLIAVFLLPDRQKF